MGSEADKSNQKMRTSDSIRTEVYQNFTHFQQMGSSDGRNPKYKLAERLHYLVMGHQNKTFDGIPEQRVR